MIKMNNSVNLNLCIYLLHFVLESKKSIKVHPDVAFHKKEWLESGLKSQIGTSLNKTWKNDTLVFVTELIFCNDPKSNAKLPLAFCQGNHFVIIRKI